MYFGAQGEHLYSGNVEIHQYIRRTVAYNKLIVVCLFFLHQFFPACLILQLEEVGIRTHRDPLLL